MTYDASNDKIGEDIRQLAIDTVMKLHALTSNSPEIRSRSRSLVGYVLNDTLTVMQFIEYLIATHKQTTAKSYDATVGKFNDEL